MGADAPIPPFVRGAATPAGRPRGGSVTYPPSFLTTLPSEVSTRRLSDPEGGGQSHNYYHKPTNTLLSIPATSQSTTTPVFGSNNIAKHDLINSRRRLPHYSGTNSAFLGIITSRIRGVEGNEVQPGPQRAPISKRVYRGFLTVIKPHPTGVICLIPRSSPGVTRLIVSSSYFTKRNLQTGIRFSNSNRDRDQKPFRKNQ
jgi:hypothetical protein